MSESSDGAKNFAKRIMNCSFIYCAAVLQNKCCRQTSSWKRQLGCDAGGSRRVTTTRRSSLRMARCDLYVAAYIWPQKAIPEVLCDFKLQAPATPDECIKDCIARSHYGRMNGRGDYRCVCAGATGMDSAACLLLSPAPMPSTPWAPPPPGTATAAPPAKRSSRRCPAL